MKKFTTAAVMVIVLSLGIFASVAAAANGNGNGNGAMDKGGTNTCQPGFHDQAGTCVHNGDAAGNCGQNQSGDTGNGNGSNQGNGGDKGYGNHASCDAGTPAAPPPASPPPPATPPASTPPAATPPTTTSAPAAPAEPETNKTPAPAQQQTAAHGVYKPPAVKHKPKKAQKHHAAVKHAKALVKIAKAPRKAPFTK